MRNQSTAARMTVSVPRLLQAEINQVRQNLGISQSELIKRACELFLRQQRQEKLQQAAERLARYYISDPELIAFTDLDADEFK